MRPLNMSSFYGLKLLVISLLDNKNEAEYSLIFMDLVLVIHQWWLNRCTHFDW